MLRTVKIASFAILWLVPLLVLISTLSYGWIPAWRAIGVRALLPPFSDLRAIAGGAEAVREGKDPLVANPADTNGHPLNYPRIWLHLFSALRINVRNLWAVAVPFCAFYLICMSVLIARARYVGDALILLIASLSISPMLALERGNNDLFVFSLVFLSCATTNQYIKSIALAGATLLKIFPVAGMMIEAFRRPAKERILPVLFIAFVFVLFVLQWHDINLIRHSTPISRSRSYGFLSLQQEILHYFPGSVLPSIQMGWVVLVGCGVVVLSAVDLAWKRGLDLDPALFESPQGEMFSVFGGIYVFTYAIGSNWDYRLMFLLPTLPFALELVRTAQFRRWAMAYLVLVGFAENAQGLEGFGGTPLGHLATFMLFVLVLIVLTQQAKSLVTAEAAISASVVPSS